MLKKQTLLLTICLIFLSLESTVQGVSLSQKLSINSSSEEINAVKQSIAEVFYTLFNEDQEMLKNIVPDLINSFFNKFSEDQLQLISSPIFVNFVQGAVEGLKSEELKGSKEAFISSMKMLIKRLQQTNMTSNDDIQVSLKKFVSLDQDNTKNNAIVPDFMIGTTLTAATCGATLTGTTCNSGTCPAGTYATCGTATPQYTCVDCTPGKYDKRGSAASTQVCNSCEDCEAGKFSGVKATSCTAEIQPACERPNAVPSAVATKSTDGKSVFCSCPAGSYPTITATTPSSSASTVVVPANSWLYTDVESRCNYCPEGKFQKAASQAQCDECPTGTFQDEKGKSECKPCGDKAAAPAGSKSCSFCIFVLKGECQDYIWWPVIAVLAVLLFGMLYAMYKAPPGTFIKVH